MEFVILIVKLDHFLIVAIEASPSSNHHQYDANALSGQEYLYWCCQKGQ
jgi:hypothetical protein